MSREGRLFKRCTTCTKTVLPSRKRCECGGRKITWAYRIDTAPKGAPRQQEYAGGFETKDEAREALDEVRKDLRSGTHVKPSRQTVAEYLSSWLETIRPPAIRGGTWQSYREHVEWYITPRVGDVRLQELTRTQVKALYADLAASGRRKGPGGLAPKTVHNVHVTLRRALEVACEDGLIVRNPASKAHRLPRDSSGETPTWAEDELRRFLEHVRDDRLYALWRTFAYTGTRRGELAGLHRDRLDLEASILTVNWQRAKGEDGRIEEGAPKTPRGRRAIDLDPETVRILREHLKRQTEERLAWGPGYEHEGHVFCREDGRPYHPDVIGERFVELAKAAGVPRITLHGLRHLHGSIMLRAGVPLHIVSRRLGHADEAFTARVYAHVLPQQGAEAAAAFAGALEGEGNRRRPIVGR